MDLLHFMAIIALTLFVITGIRGGMALRSTGKEAITIEEGLDLIRRRITARDHLHMLLAVILTGILTSGLYLFISGTGSWLVFSSALILAILIVGSGFLLMPWFRTPSTSRILRLLEQTPNTARHAPQGQLRRMLRTYIYYNRGPLEKKPALFDWVRRQLGLYILGLDVRAHIPFSPGQIAKSAGIMTACVILLTVLLSLTNEVPAQHTDNFAEGTSPGETVDESLYRGAPDPDGNKSIPPDRADGALKNPSSDNREDIPSDPADPPQDKENLAGADSRTNDENFFSDRSGPTPKPSEKDDQADKKSPDQKGWLSDLLKLVQDILPGKDEPQTAGGTGDKRPGGMAGLHSGAETTKKNTETAQVQAPGQSEEGLAPSDEARTGEQSSASGMAASTSDNPRGSPGDGGEGASGRPRISRGDGGRVVGQATAVPTAVNAGAAVVRLEVDQDAAGESDRLSEQSARPRRYNPLLEVQPDDITLTPADPVQTQRIPANYEPAIKRLLSKP